MSIRDKFLEEINKKLRMHEAKLEDIKREERTTEGYIIGEESNRNKTTTQILSKEIEHEGHKYALRIVQLDAEYPSTAHEGFVRLTKIVREAGYMKVVE